MISAIFILLVSKHRCSVSGVHGVHVGHGLTLMNSTSVWTCCFSSHSMDAVSFLDKWFFIKSLSSNNNCLLISLFLKFFLSYHFIYISLKGLFGSGQISNSLQKKTKTATELGRQPITFSYNWMQSSPLKPRETVKGLEGTFVFGSETVFRENLCTFSP